MSAIELVNLDLNRVGQLATTLAKIAHAGDCFALQGDLGAGKTTFSQHFIRSLLNAPQDVTSPTFTIVQWYDTRAGFRICHADLYRLKHESELFEIGLEEAYEQHVLLVEWPEIARNHLPEDTLYLSIVQQVDDTRTIHLHSHSEEWEQRLAEAGIK
jgi:tRNA threonylcarbamoyladenosine biosynthesis protein TsaE